jgi:hypothetical protein
MYHAKRSLIHNTNVAIANYLMNLDRDEDIDAEKHVHPLLSQLQTALVMYGEIAAAVEAERQQ